MVGHVAAAFRGMWRVSPDATRQQSTAIPAVVDDSRAVMHCTNFVVLDVDLHRSLEPDESAPRTQVRNGARHEWEQAGRR